MKKSVFPPEFTNAMHEYNAIAKKHGEESERARIAFTKAMLKAPKWFQDEANEMAVEMGLIPKNPSGYNDLGEPIYTLHDLAKTLGIEYEEAEERLHELLAQRDAAGLSNAGIVAGGTFNRRQ